MEVLGSQESCPLALSLCVSQVRAAGLSRVLMEGTEARQRRLEGCGRLKELGPLPSHDAGRLPKASEEGHLAVSESQLVDAKSLEAPPGRETSLIIGFQVVIPFLLAGMGLSWAGLLLNYFQVRDSFLGTGQPEEWAAEAGWRVVRCIGQGSFSLTQVKHSKIVAGLMPYR
jgi:hypothetical protein